MEHTAPGEAEPTKASRLRLFNPILLLEENVYAGSEFGDSACDLVVISRGESATVSIVNLASRHNRIAYVPFKDDADSVRHAGSDVLAVVRP